MVEARYYEKKEKNVICRLCPQNCRIEPDSYGKCRIRKNVDGTLFAEGYGHTISLTNDPIEKKPIYHFHPGKDILSIGPNGCNLSCFFCQNWTISQSSVKTRFFSPEDLIKTAKKTRSIGIAYTYTEPLVWFEYLYDCARLAHEQGIVNVCVTNGYISPEPLDELLPHIDAMNIDLKSIRNKFYREQCGATLKPVLRTIMTANALCHIEITNLIITGLNDSEEDITELVEWIADVDNEIPLHLSRYFPHYQCDAPLTPLETLIKAYEIASDRLTYVYIGNARIEGTSDTKCKRCGNILISRDGYSIRISGITNHKCSNCGLLVDLIL